MPVWSVLPSVTKRRACADDRCVVLRGRRILQDIRIAVRFDHHVDQVHGKGVVESRRQAAGSGQMRIDLHQEHSIGVGAGLDQFVAGRPQMQRQIAPFRRRRGVRPGRS